MTTPRRRSRRLTWTIVIVVGLGILWCGYWYTTHRFAAAALEKARTSFADGGRQVGCSEGAIGGFPLSLTLDCANPTFADGSGALSAELARITATAPLYWPGRVITALSGPLVLKAPSGVILNAVWRDAVAKARAGFGGLTGVGVSVDGLSLDAEGRDQALPITRLSANHAESQVEPAGGDAYRFTADADGFVVTPSDAPTLPELAGSVDVTAIQFGHSLGTDPRAAFANWLANGGQLRIARLTVATGESSATASGEMLISQDGLVSADLNVRLVGLQALPGIAETIKPGSGDNVAQMVMAAAALTKSVEGQPDARDVPVTIRDSVVSIGFIPLGTIPPIPF